MESQVQSVNVFRWLLTSGGAGLLALGVVLTLLGMVLLMRPNRRACLILACLACLPAIFGLISIIDAAQTYGEMATSPSPPRPSEFAGVTGRAMSYSFCALLGTIMPLFVVTLALYRMNLRGPATNVEGLDPSGD